MGRGDCKVGCRAKGGKPRRLCSAVPGSRSCKQHPCETRACCYYAGTLLQISYLKLLSHGGHERGAQPARHQRGHLGLGGQRHGAAHTRALPRPASSSRRIAVGGDSRLKDRRRLHGAGRRGKSLSCW